MAVDVRATARAVGETFAAAIESRPDVRRLWVSPDRDTIHLWLEVGPIDADQERELYELYELVDVIYERFQDVAPFLHVLNPVNYRVGIHTVVPRQAEEVRLRTR